jgi:hypothetical protein
VKEQNVPVDVQRRAISSTGTRRTLLVRITAPDVACQYSASALWSNVFSGDGSVTTQLSLCSSNQINISPAWTTAYEVRVTTNARNSDRMSLVNEAYPLVIDLIRRTESSTYGSLQKLEDYADLLLFVVVRICSSL